MDLCFKCCENVKKFDGECWRNVCKITGARIKDTSKSWVEGSDSLFTCDMYRGPIGFDFNEWNKKFIAAILREMDQALDEERVNQSEIIKVFCK